MLVGTNAAHPHVLGRPALTAILRDSEIGIGHISGTGLIVARIIERDGDITSNRIDGHPVIESIYFERQSIRHGLRRRPAGAAIVRVG